MSMAGATSGAPAPHLCAPLFGQGLQVLTPSDALLQPLLSAVGFDTSVALHKAAFCLHTNDFSVAFPVCFSFTKSQYFGGHIYHAVLKKNQDHFDFLMF